MARVAVAARRGSSPGPRRTPSRRSSSCWSPAGWGCDALSDVQALSAIPGSGHALRWSDPAGLSRGRGLGRGWWRRGSVAPHHQGQIEALGKHVRRSTNTVLQARQRCGQQGRVWRRGAIVSLPTVPAQPGRDRGSGDCRRRPGGHPVRHMSLPGVCTPLLRLSPPHRIRGRVCCPATRWRPGCRSRTTSSAWPIGRSTCSEMRCS